ncbi:MAG: DUF488 domain-containing protein [Phycisphaerae bacterium]|nr:DUF488 domain-containing protein [Phycisphaerae bacterium]
MKLFTIGFTKKTAEQFFTRLQKAKIKRIVDVRLNNTSQLAGFAKAGDLKYFLEAIAQIEYLHVPECAPTQEVLDAFKKDKGAWVDYERMFAELLTDRRIAQWAAGMLRDADCLLCSEDTPEHCHRRLVAEHIQKHMENVEVIHL